LADVTNTGPARPLQPCASGRFAEKVGAGNLETISPAPLASIRSTMPWRRTPARKLILLGGSQGVGKTTMAFQMARNIAASGEANCLYICYEHDEEAMAQRSSPWSPSTDVQALRTA